MIRQPPAELRAAVRRRSPERIADLLVRVPALAEALGGRGPLVYFRPGFPRSQQQPTLDRLAVLMDSDAGIDVTIAELDQFAFQLLTTAAFHGGTMDRATALTEVGPHREAELDAAVQTLDDLMLIDPAAGWLVLRPRVARMVRLPGLPFRTFAEYLNSDVVANMLRGFGVSTPPSKKMQRVAALEQQLRDPAAVHDLLERLSPDAQRVFDLLTRLGPQHVRDLGISYYQTWGHANTPVHELVRAGLIGVDSADQTCWVWLDVIVGVNGRLFAEWPTAAASVDTKPLREHAGLPPGLGRFAAVLNHWAGEPAPALATGGLGVRPVRAAAKALGMPAGEVGLLATLAVSLGLLGRIHTGSKGRGRARTDTWMWAPTKLAEEFAALPADRRWALLVQAWRDDLDLDESEGLPERVEESTVIGASLARSALLRLLQPLPPGTGLELDALVAHAGAASSGGAHGPAVGHLVDAARVLGLVPPDGPVGLTSLARALLDGPDALAAALPPPRSEFTVQADLSVIAPPDLAPEVATQLERYAELESATGARTYRLSERRLLGALDTGETADDILAFLAEHATAPLAQNVEYLIRDCQRRHGRVRAGSCASYVRSDDPAMLSGAVAVKAAKLRLLAPTVAVSSLPRTKVVAALRAKNIMATAEDADGIALVTPAASAIPAVHVDGLPQVRTALEPRRDDAEALARKLLETAPSLSEPPGRRRDSQMRFMADEPWSDAEDFLDELELQRRLGDRRQA